MSESQNYPLDRTGLQVLPVAVCLERLASASLGRVAFVQNGEPVILPVSHGISGTSVIFRTPIGSKLFAADRGLPVSFESDWADRDGHAGWSVVVRGVAEIVDDPVEVAHLNTLGIRAWAINASTEWVRIRPYEITGRQVAPLE